MTAVAGRAEKSVARALASNRSFSLYFSTFFVSNIGMFMQALGVPFVLYGMTKSKTWVGAGGFCSQMSAFAVTPLAGTLADRVSRRMVLVLSQIIQLGSATFLWLLAISHALTPWRILGVLIIGGLGAGFQHTTAQAILPQIVEPDHFKSAMRAFPLCFNLPRAFGPLIAGVVLRKFGASTTFAVNALSFVPFILVIAFMHLRPAVLAGSAERWGKQFVEGYRYARANRSLWSAITLVFMMSLLGMSMLSHIADIGTEIYKVRADGLGVVSAAVGIGSVLASIAVVRIGDRLQNFRLGIAGILVQGLAVIAAVATHSFAVALASFFTFGLGNLMTGISMSVVVQTTTEDAYRGRVGSLYMSGYLLGGPIGALAIGVVADRIGLAPTVGIFGGLLLAFGVVTALGRAKSSRFSSPSIPSAG
jgi:predicted MFS family arabinose efflux permease